MALHARAQPVQRTPLPWKELSVIIVVLTTESTSFQYLFPFVPFMVRGFGVVEENVGFYSGWIASSFMVGQFFSSFFWGRMSDVVGLKPVMLVGMTFTALTTVLFGLSHSLEWALAVRFIGGLFSGSRPVCQAYIACSVAWACSGAIVAPSDRAASQVTSASISVPKSPLSE